MAEEEVSKYCESIEYILRAFVIRLVCRHLMV